MDQVNTNETENSSLASLSAITAEQAAASEAPEQNADISPEYLQRKLYFLLEHLKRMHSELPE